MSTSSQNDFGVKVTFNPVLSKDNTTFKANIAIVNPSPTSKDMMSKLPDNYVRSQNSNIYGLMYGSGYAMERLKQTLKQLEANNYLYSPDSQTRSLQITGSGKYLVQFDIPFVVPPLNVSVSGADYSDAFIEYADRFGMIINVQTDIKDVLIWNASGFVGAATDEYLGDALYQNFGALFNFPRQGDSQINATFIKRYLNVNKYIIVENVVQQDSLVGLKYEYIDGTTAYTAVVPVTGGMLDSKNLAIYSEQQTGVSFDTTQATPVLAIVEPNQLALNTNYIPGFIQPTTVVTKPQATHELVDNYGNVIALLDASTLGQSVSSFYRGNGLNYYMNTYPNQKINVAGSDANSNNSSVTCYVTGIQTSFEFSPWDQLSYQQEVFRADNKYRRLLAGINLSLQEGPSKQGIANIVETLFAQPYIPFETWTDSDFRVFTNSPGMAHSKLQTGTNSSFVTEFDTYPAGTATVRAQGVQNIWNPQSITFNNAPEAFDIPNVNAVPPTATTTLPITSLNAASRFDIYPEVIKQLRLGFDPNSFPQGGILNWNYADYSNDFETLGFPMYEGNLSNQPTPFNYIFLNNANDTYAGIKLFYYYAKTTGTPPSITDYECYGPLKYNTDYVVVPTTNFLVPGTINTYNLPSNLLSRFSVNANGYGNPDTDTSTANEIYNFINPSVVDGYPYWVGENHNDLPGIPQFLIQIKLNRANIKRLNYTPNSEAPLFLLNNNDYLVYSYTSMAVNSASVDGEFVGDPIEPQFVEYCEPSQSSTIVQPSNSPFANNNTYTLAQTPFARFKTPTDYVYTVSMLGGQITFNKTILTSELLSLPPILPDPSGASRVLPQNNYYAQNDSTMGPPIFFDMLAVLATNVDSFTVSLQSAPLSSALGAYKSYTAPYYFQYGADGFVLQGYIDKISKMDPVTFENNLVTQYQLGTYCLRQHGTGALLAIFSDSSPQYSYFAQQYIELTTGSIPASSQLVVTGSVYKTIWDTRIPVSYYDAQPPVFQASSNYGVDVTTFTPMNEIENTTTFNSNFLVVIDGLPGGNQESVTASWSFAVQNTTINGQTYNNSNLNNNTLRFADTESGNEFAYGIMSLFCGRSNVTYRGLNSLNQIIDLDNAAYNQTYSSPYFNAYFLNYKDYLGNLGTGAYFSPDGDNPVVPFYQPVNDTLVADFNPTLSNPNYNSVLNFFSPNFGFISISILPNMTFVNTVGNTPINVIRPNNNGIKLTMENPSRSGLVFYGKNGNKIVDKPTRLVVTYTYDAAQLATRKKVVQIEDGGYAAWTDALHPNQVNPDDTFFVSGNQYKYANKGFDQADSQYSDIFGDGITIGNYTNYESIAESGNTPYAADPNKPLPSPGNQVYSCNETPYNEYTYYGPNLYYPTFLIDPSLPPNTLPGETGNPGPVTRFRRAADPNFINSNLSAGLNYTSYVNPGPQKDAYLQFDLSDFPYDTIIKDAHLEIYFASGFTIKEGKEVNFTLNKNKAWEKSRLSGNGRTFVDSTGGSSSVNYNRPLNNIHWRKNFYEILLPYAFLSEPQDLNYGIRTIFGNNINQNTVPNPTNPIENLEYLGFINLDEIDSSSLITDTFSDSISGIRGSLIENTVGLANVVLTQNSVIYGVNGILTFTPLASGQQIFTYDDISVLDLVAFNSQQYLSYTPDIDGNPQYYDIIEGGLVPYNNITFDSFGTPLTYTDNSGTYPAYEKIRILPTPLNQSGLLPNQKILLFPYGISNPQDPASSFFYYGTVKSVLPSSLIGFSPTDISIYQQALEYVSPLYGQYTVKLLESDTYFPYTTFGRDTSISGTQQDISY